MVKRPPQPLTLMLQLGGAQAAAARVRLKRLVDQNDGRIPAMALELVVGRDTIIRLLERAELSDYAAEVRVRAGVPGPRTAQVGVPRPRK